jgi:ribonuclease PH
MLIRQAVRNEHAARDISFVPNVSHGADGSCFIKMGKTHVLCTTIVDKNQSGIQVDYGIAPAASFPRASRQETLDSTERAQIQEIIARGLRTILDHEVLQKCGLLIDCDVLQSEGSLKAACVSGSYVATALALKKMTSFLFPNYPLVGQIAGVTCGIVMGAYMVDLDQQEAIQADVLVDFVFNEAKDILSMDIRAQNHAISSQQLQKLTELALQATVPIFEAQRRVLAQA